MQSFFNSNNIVFISLRHTKLDGKHIHRTVDVIDPEEIKDFCAHFVLVRTKRKLIEIGSPGESRWFLDVLDKSGEVKRYTITASGIYEGFNRRKVVGMTNKQLYLYLCSLTGKAKPVKVDVVRLILANTEKKKNVMTQLAKVLSDLGSAR